jgi:hypothetical protein
MFLKKKIYWFYQGGNRQGQAGFELPVKGF